MPKEPKETLVLDVHGCARCGGDGHDALTFEHFTRPPGRYTHWAMCPTVSEPILLRRVTLDGESYVTEPV